VTPAAPKTPEEGRPLRPVPKGRYVEFTPLAEGGMGVVYLALDTDLNRQVAMKIVRPIDAPRGSAPGTPFDLAPPPAASDTAGSFGELRQRFLREAMVTGLMEHPGVIPVYELGQTEAGVPYYTMRYVRGRRTLRVAMDEASGREARWALLEPFLKICDTLAYAHARGIIHRDLKPENVALGSFGEVIVLDWGIAKIRGGVPGGGRPTVLRVQKASSGSETLEGVLGTPGYMSPEAAAGDLDQVDERSDVYGLGTLLYEILTGRLPFDAGNVVRWMERSVREDAPLARTIDPSVPAELEAVCAAALVRDPAKRLPSAGELADRVRAWQRASAVERENEGLRAEAEAALRASEGLRGDPLVRQLDRAASAATRLLERAPEDARGRAVLDAANAQRERGVRERESLARRRLLGRVGVAAVGVAAVAAFFVARALDQRRQEAEGSAVRAIAAEATATTAKERAEGERRRADAEAAEAKTQRDAARSSQAAAEAERKKAQEAEAVAKKNLDRAETLMSFLLFEMRDELRPIGRLSVLERLATKALEFFDALPPESRTATTLRHEGVALDLLGDVQDDRGDRQAALATYRKALEIGRRLSAATPDDLNLAHDVSVDHNKIGAVLHQLGESDEALASFRASLAILRDLAKKQPNETLWKHSLSITLTNVGDELTVKGDKPGATEVLEEALSLARTLRAAGPEEAKWPGLVATALESLGSFRNATGDTEGALATYQEALGVRASVLAQTEGNRQAQHELAVAQSNVAVLLQELGRTDEALETGRAWLANAQALAEADTTNLLWLRSLGGARDLVAAMLERKGEAGAEAAELRRLGLVLWKALAEQVPDDLARQGKLSTAYGAYAEALVGLGDLATAVAVRKEALAFQSQLADRHPDMPGLRRDESVSHNDLGRVQLATGDAAGAAASHRAAARLMEALVAKHPEEAGWKADLYYARWRLGLALSEIPASRADGIRTVKGALSELKALDAAGALDEHAKGWLPEIEATLEGLRAPPKIDPPKDAPPPK